MATVLLADSTVTQPMPTIFVRLRVGLKIIRNGCIVNKRETLYMFYFNKKLYLLILVLFIKSKLPKMVVKSFSLRLTHSTLLAIVSSIRSLKSRSNVCASGCSNVHNISLRVMIEKLTIYYVIKDLCGVFLPHLANIRLRNWKQYHITIDLVFSYRRPF